MLNGNHIAGLLELQAQGLSIREASRRTRLTRNTVSKALSHRELFCHKPRPPVTSKLGEYKPYILQRVRPGVTSCERLLRETWEQGYTGSHSILRESSGRSGDHAKRQPQFGMTPGPAVDFGTFVYDDVGKRQRYYAFIMVLSYSMMVVECVERPDMSTLIGCHLRGFAELGIPETVLYDSLKPVVLGPKDAAGALERALDNAAKAKLSYSDLLAELLAAEQPVRRERYVVARTRLAHLPYHRLMSRVSARP